MKNDNWLKDKLTLTMTRREFSDIANVFAQAQYSDIEFTKIRDIRIRKLFRDTILKRHKLWLKITRLTNQKTNQKRFK